MATKNKGDFDLVNHPVIISQLGEEAKPFATATLSNGSDITFFENDKTGLIHYFYVREDKLAGASTIVTSVPFTGEEITEEAVKKNNLEATVKTVTDWLNKELQNEDKQTE